MFYSIFDNTVAKECPLIEGKCIQGNCAWWMRAGAKEDDGSGSCAISVVAHGNWITAKNLKSQHRQPMDKGRVRMLRNEDENYGNR